MEMMKFSIENDVFIPPVNTKNKLSKELFQFHVQRIFNWLALIMIHTLGGITNHKSLMRHILKLTAFIAVGKMKKKRIR